MPDMLREARDRDDQYALGGYRLLCMAWLAADDPLEARRQADAALATQPASDFHTQHYLALLGQGQIDLYLGDARAAWNRVAGAWRALTRAQLLRAEHVRVEMRQLRARCALALLAETHAHEGTLSEVGWRPGRLPRFVEREIRRLAVESLPAAAPFAELLRAAAEAQRGETASAGVRLRTAAGLLEGIDMQLYAAAARHEAAWLAKDGSARLREEEWIAGRGIADPARVAAVLVPGVRCLAPWVTRA